MGPLDQAVPAGWNRIGVSGEKQYCLNHIAKIWTDMRPLSLRRYLTTITVSAVPRSPPGTCIPGHPALFE
nr:MbtH family NRPS accessory protein [Streptomyces sp. 3214.6]